MNVEAMGMTKENVGVYARKCVLAGGKFGTV